MPELIEWPCELLRLTSCRVFLKHTTRTSGVSLAGTDQIISSGAAHWEVRLSLPVYAEEQMIKDFEAHVSMMRGRLNIADLCLYDRYRYGEQVSPLQDSRFDDTDDGAWFDDGTGFLDESGGVQPMVVEAGSAAGANTLTVGMTEPVRPSFRRGDMFSVNGFLYRVVRRNDQGWVRFEPDAREAIPAGTVLQTDPPRFHGRFATDDEGARARDILSYAAPISLTFVEAFDRVA